MERVIWTAVCAATSLAAAAPAAAQATGDFERDRNVSVRERPRPDYEAAGLRTGAFLLYPKLTLGADLDDNIYAANQNKRTDVIALVQPEITARSNWSRNEVDGYVRGVINQYIDQSRESTTDLSLGGSGRLDLLRNADLSGGFDYGHLTEPRTSTNTARDTARPVRYDMFGAHVGGRQEFDRLRLTGRFDYQSFTYQNEVDFAGNPVLQKDRDRDIWLATGRAEYAISPAIYVFGSGTYNIHDYRLKPPQALLDRSGNGYDLDVGANFDLTRLVRGEVRVGYLSQQYDSNQFRPVSGISARGVVEYFPTQLTTVTGNLDRSVQDAADPRASSFLTTGGGVQVDHELLRNVILTARAAYQNDAYKGIDRTDDQWTARLSATYLVNRRIGVTLYYSHIDVNSSGFDRINNYKVNQLAIALVLQL